MYVIIIHTFLHDRGIYIDHATFWVRNTIVAHMRATSLPWNIFISYFLSTMKPNGESLLSRWFGATEPGRQNDREGVEAFSILCGCPNSPSHLDRTGHSEFAQQSTVSYLK